MTGNETYEVEQKCLSICVPCYNVERYLNQCLNSIFASSLHKYLDVIIVNDGSKDSTLKIANDYARRYPENTLVIDKENGGHGSGINVALKHATGKYFMVVDSDDWIDTSDFTKLIEHIHNNDYYADIVSMNYQLVDEKTGMVTTWRHEYEPQYEQHHHFGEIDVQNSYFTLAGTLFKTDVLKKQKRSLQEHTFYDDVEYILFPIPYVDTVLYSELSIYRYRRGNKEQSVSIANMIKHIDHHERILKSVLDYRSKQMMSHKQAEYYDCVLKRVLRTHYSLCLDHMAIYEGNRQIRDFDEYLCKEHPHLAKSMKENMWKVALGRVFKYNTNNACYIFLLKLMMLMQSIKRTIEHRFSEER